MRIKINSASNLYLEMLTTYLIKISSLFCSFNLKINKKNNIIFKNIIRKVMDTSLLRKAYLLSSQTFLSPSLYDGYK